MNYSMKVWKIKDGDWACQVTVSAPDGRASSEDSGGFFEEAGAFNWGQMAMAGLRERAIEQGFVLQ